MNERPAIFYVLQSRKFWSAVVGLLAILYVAWVKGDTLDPNTIVNAILGIVAAYMGATAFEDGMSKQAEANATTTTISTPGESNVTVIAPDATPTPATPPVPAPFVPSQRMTAEESLRARGGPAGMV